MFRNQSLAIFSVLGSKQAKTKCTQNENIFSGAKNTGQMPVWYSLRFSSGLNTRLSS